MTPFIACIRSFAGSLLLATLALVPVNAAPAAGVDATPIDELDRAVPGPGDADPVLYEAVLPELRHEIMTETGGWLSRYRIDATLTPPVAAGPARVSGSIDLRFVNDREETLSAVYFRLYANDAAYDPGEMTLAEVTIDGVPARFDESLHRTLLQVDTPAPIVPGGAVDVRLTFETLIPTRPRLSYGIMAVQPELGTIAMAHWFPLLAGRDANGWNLAPVSRNGDPVFANTALFDVTLTAPAAAVILASGVAIAEEAAGDQVRRRYVTGPAREFTVIADDDFASVSRDVNGTRVTSYFQPAQATPGGQVLDYAAQALEIFGARFGRYPYRELDLAQVELQGAGGVEFPQLIYMGDDLYHEWSSPNPLYLEFVTAHEVIHQWWYGLVGNNQYLHAFMDEGLAEYCSSELYFTAAYASEVGRRQLDLEVKLWYLTSLFSSGDAVVDQPTDDFPGSALYGATVYAKGALGFAALHDEIGDEAFVAGLRAYAEQHRFGVATPADLRAALETAAGRDLGPTWRHWFELAEGTEDFTPADLDQLRGELGLRPES